MLPQPQHQRQISARVRRRRAGGVRPAGDPRVGQRALRRG
jgi:hypothetical protein